MRDVNEKAYGASLRRFGTDRCGIKEQLAGTNASRAAAALQGKNQRAKEALRAALTIRRSP